MANYFVSNARGNDSTGTGTATSPWATIGKAIGSSPAITLSGTGDTLYIEPGIYREVVTLGLSPTSGGPLTIQGDFDGSGFLAGGYSTPATGKVDWRAWTDDVTAITGTTMNAVGKSYVTLRRLKITGGGNVVVCSGDCTNWTIERCVLLPNKGSNAGILWTGSTGGLAQNLTIRQCWIFAPSYNGFFINLPLHTSEYNAVVVVENCVIDSGRIAAQFQTVGSGSFLATGIQVRNNYIRGSSGCVNVYQSNAVNLTTPVGVYNNIIVQGTGVQANNTTQMIEDGNAFITNTPRTNVTSGANSKTDVSPALDFGDWVADGLPPRPYLEPSRTSVFVGFGDFSGGAAPTVDLMNRTRPEGGGSTLTACGPLGRHDTGVKNTTFADTGSGACLALVGPSSQDRPLIVDAAAVVIRIKVRWDGNHGNTNKPQAILLSNPEIGVAAQTVTATSTGGTGSTPNSYETLTFSSITPTAAGVVMLRMVSRAAAGNGVAYFDAITFS